MIKYLLFISFLLLECKVEGQTRLFKNNDVLTEVAPDEVRKFLELNPNAMEIVEFEELTGGEDYPNDIIYSKTDKEYETYKYVTADLLNVRGGPGKEYSIRYQLKLNDSVMLLGENNNFYKIIAVSKHFESAVITSQLYEVGYVSKKFIGDSIVYINDDDAEMTEIAAPAVNLDIDEPVEPAPAPMFVTVNNLNARSKPSIESKILYKLNQNDIVSIVGRVGQFCKIIHNGQTAYVADKYLSYNKVPTWERVYINTGESNQCENISPKYSYYYNIQFRIINQLDHDVAFKLVRRNDDECIRFIYIKSGESYNINNIPEGIYYYKYASGGEYSQKIENGICKTRFLKNARYVLGENNVDFYVKRTASGYSVPTNQLTLYSILTSNKYRNQGGTDISPSKFDE